MQHIKYKVNRLAVYAIYTDNKYIFLFHKVSLMIAEWFNKVKYDMCLFAKAIVDFCRSYLVFSIKCINYDFHSMK